MKARVVDVGDAHLSVYDAGSGQAVVFLHGYGNSKLPSGEPYLNIEEPETFTTAITHFIEEHPPRR